MLEFVVIIVLQVEKRIEANRSENEQTTMTHILRFPPGSSVTFTNLLQKNQFLFPLEMKELDGPSVVEDPLLCTALWRLLLLLGLDFWCLRLYFAGAGEGSVDWVEQSAHKIVQNSVRTFSHDVVEGVE